jgi:hypothetical protein
MKYPYLRPKWWRPGEKQLPRLGNGAALINTNEVSKGISNRPSQATNLAIKSIFIMQVIRLAIMALGINIKDF